MINFTRTQQIAFTCCCAVVLVVGGIIVVASNHTAKNAPSSKVPSTKNAAQKATSSIRKSAQSTDLTGGNTSKADQQAATNANDQPITDACKLLTLADARQLLGSDAQISTPGDTSSFQTVDTSLSTCAYTSSADRVQLIIRKPTDSTGVSENATKFGSGKPAGSTTLQGYGQAAYWDPSEHTLNVLGSNNWYIISRNSNTQADAEIAANLIKLGF